MFVYVQEPRKGKTFVSFEVVDERAALAGTRAVVCSTTVAGTEALYKNGTFVKCALHETRA